MAALIKRRKGKDEDNRSTSGTHVSGVGRSPSSIGNLAPYPGDLGLSPSTLGRRLALCLAKGVVGVTLNQKGNITRGFL